MSQATQTNTQKLAELLLETPLSEYLAGKRNAGQSYEQIARDLFAETDGRVSVSLNTVKRWLEDLEVAS